MSITREPPTTNLYLLEDLDDDTKTRNLTKNDLVALREVADWIKAYVIKPLKDIGHAGTVCPYVPGSLERKILWLAPEHVAGTDNDEVVELVTSYKRLFEQTQPSGGEGADYKVIVVVFTDLAADRAQGLFDTILQDLAVPSYAGDGILFGPYFEGSQTSAIYNAEFRPFRSPVPFLFVRNGVISDWKFFMDNQDLLNLWAGRYGASAAKALAEELRRTNWRQLG